VKGEIVMEFKTDASELLEGVHDLAKIREIAEKKLDEAENAESVADREKRNRELDEVITYYNETAKDMCFSACRNAEKPMHYAVLTFFWKGIRVKGTVDKETQIVSRQIVEAEKPIDLGALYKFMDNKLGADHMWFYTAEKLNFYLTYRAADRVGAEAVKKLLDSKSDCFLMSKIARDIDLGKNPCSNTNLLKTLNRVIKEMLGEEYEATSRDVRYLVDAYSNDNKKSRTALTAANHKTLRNYLKKVCERILTGRYGYDVEQREIREEK
jgi:hypothetical protein